MLGLARDSCPGAWVHLEVKGHCRVQSTVTTGETKFQRAQEAREVPEAALHFPSTCHKIKLSL